MSNNQKKVKTEELFLDGEDINMLFSASILSLAFLTKEARKDMDMYGLCEAYKGIITEIIKKQPQGKYTDALMSHLTAVIKSEKSADLYIKNLAGEVTKGLTPPDNSVN